ncbi:MAG: beta-propeller domain-containing protein, partial [Actinobacteria bacterium]|nr:beta-propeller domain-containing protein [Actinomycetota bacterium]
MGIRHVAVGTLVILATVAAVLVGDTPSDTDGGDRSSIRAAGDTTAELRSFDGCDQLTTHVRRILASADTSQEGVPHLAWDMWGGGTPVAMAVGREAAAGAADGATFDDAAAAAPAQKAGSVSATNVQEVGIDEPDIIETDGRLLLAVTGHELHVVDLDADPEPRLAASMRLTEGQHQLFLMGERALILTRSWHHVEPLANERGDAALMPIEIAPSRTELTLVDLRDPSAPSERATATFDGDLVSARATDGTVRLVLRSWPHDVDLRVPVEPSAASAARQHNRAALDRIGARQILPHMTVQDRAGRTLRDGPAVDCTAVSRPAAPSGVGTTTVLTLRPEDGDLIPED